jgi:hypothetical protein
MSAIVLAENMAFVVRYMMNFNVAHTANPELRKMPFGIKVLHFLKVNAVRATLLLFIELFRHFSSG